MPYERSQHVKEIMAGIATRQKTGVKGIVGDLEVPRICDMIRAMLPSKEIEETCKRRLRDLTAMHRKFTLAEADMVASWYSLMLHNKKGNKSLETPKG